MRISDIRATTIAAALRARLWHANGCHRGRFVRAVIEVACDGPIGFMMEQIAKVD